MAITEPLQTGGTFHIPDARFVDGQTISSTSAGERRMRVRRCLPTGARGQAGGAGEIEGDQTKPGVHGQRGEPQRTSRCAAGQHDGS